MLHSLTTAYRSWAFKVTIWLILAAIAGGLTFTVWVASAVKPAKNLHNKNNDNPIVVEPITLLANHNPDEMKQMVKPITFDAVIRDMRNYPAEFKDSRFVKANQGKWTLQVMNVVEHEVITDYLNSRQDRDKFNYFRIVDENNQKRFVVTYGIFNSAQEALSASKTVAFGLPNNVATFPEEFKLYASQMDEYEITPPLKDIGNNAPREVKLKSSQKELPAPKAKPKTQPAPTSKPAQPQRQGAESETVATPSKQQKPAPSIKESADKEQTLAIQEKKSVRTTQDKPAAAPKTEPKPLKIQQGTPPAMPSAEKAPSAEKTPVPPPEPTADTP